MPCVTRKQPQIRTNVRDIQPSPCPPSALLCRVSRSLTLTRLAVDTDDKEQNDRLIQAAVSFCEQHAKTYKVPEASGGNAADPWQLVQGQAVNYKFVASGEASADGKRPFGVKVGWLDAFEPGLVLRVVLPPAVGLCEPLELLELLELPVPCVLSVCC